MEPETYRGQLALGVLAVDTLPASAEAGLRTLLLKRVDDLFHGLLSQPSVSDGTWWAASPARPDELAELPDRRKHSWVV